MARSTFPSRNEQNTPAPEHFWKLRRRKSARRCGANFEVKMLKHRMFGPLLDVQMSFAWQAHGMVHLVKGEQDVRVLWQFQLQPPLHYTNYTTLHYTPLDCFTLQLETTTTTTLHHTILHYTTLEYTNYTYYTTLHYTQLHYTTLLTLHHTTRQLIKLQLQLRYFTLYYTRLH